MSKSSTIALAQLLGGGQGSQLQEDRYYVEAVRRMGVERDWISQVTLVDGVVGQATYTMPAAAVRPLAVLYDDHELVRENQLSLDAHTPQWRDRVGRPQGWIEDTTTNEFTIFPAPRAPGQPFIPVFFDPLGRDFPGDNVALIHTEERDDVPEWMELMLALQLVAQEFLRDSDHRDVGVTAAAKALVTMTAAAVG